MSTGDSVMRYIVKVKKLDNIIRVNDMEGHLLDKAVSVLQGKDRVLPYSTDWGLGGPLIPAHNIELKWGPILWAAFARDRFGFFIRCSSATAYGPLQAAMRAYVALAMGAREVSTDDFYMESEDETDNNG